LLALGVVWILIAALPIGMLIGLIGGGSLTSTRSIELRNWYLLVPAFAIVVVMAIDRDPPAEWVLLPTALVLFAVVAFRNITTVGMTVVGVGVLANLAPVLANGEMPVRESAVIAAELADSTNIDQVLLGAGRRFEESGDVLTQLSAIVPVQPVREVLTIGDLIVIAGLINVGFRMVRPSTRRREEATTDMGMTDPPFEQADVGPAVPIPALGDILDLTALSRRDGPTQQSQIASLQATDDELRSPEDLYLDDLPRVVQGSATWGD